MMDCTNELLEYPNSPRGAITKLPKCLQIFFNREVPSTSFSGDRIKACKVALLGVRLAYGKLEGTVFEGMAKILAHRQGVKLERIMEIATNLPAHHEFHCDLIKKHSDFAEEAKCSMKGDWTRLIDMDPNDHTVKTVEVTWTELSIVTIPSEISIFCEANDFDDVEDLPNRAAIKMVGGMSKRVEQNFIGDEFGLVVCPTCGRRKLRLRVTKYQDVLMLLIKDLDMNIHSWEAEVEESYPCYIFPGDKEKEKEMVKRIETANKITMSTRLSLRNTQNNIAQKILECTAIHDTDKRFSYTSVSTEMLKTFRIKLGGSYEDNLRLLSNSFAGWIGGREWEKEVFLIWCFSAPDDPMTLAFIGDSRVGKSDIFISALTYIVKFEEPADNKAADCDVVLQGENIRRTVFYIHKRGPDGEFKLVKGKALRAQHGRLFIDSMTKCNQEIINITREAIPQGQMIVGGAGATQSRTIDFVTRYGITMNLTKEFGNFPTRYNAWREGIPNVFEYFDFKRFSLVVPFAQEDVDADLMGNTMDDFNAANIMGLSSEEFRMLKIFCDGLDKDRYYFEPGVEVALSNLYIRKMRKFEHSFTHPYSADLRLHLRKMVKGIAFIGFNIAGDDRIHVKLEHVRRLEGVLDQFEEAWEFDLMLIEEEQFKYTVMEVYYKLKGMQQKAPKRYKIYSEIARRGSITIEDLARAVGEDVMDVFTNLNRLRKDELVSQPVRSKFTLTHLGNEVYKLIIEDLKKFIAPKVSEDVSDLVISQMHGCKTDNRGFIEYADIIWICPGIDPKEVFHAVQILKQRGIITEPETGFFVIV
jgi:hypothetical protein